MCGVTGVYISLPFSRSLEEARMPVSHIPRFSDVYFYYLSRSYLERIFTIVGKGFVAD